mmetsp:Transcript_49221/g.96529  ORF Transcript_49221/g.96529 Transcript_49221/m.96529 type:complete len:133 (-) Transcript_49221:687-1085(-)
MEEETSIWWEWTMGRGSKGVPDSSLFIVRLYQSVCRIECARAAKDTTCEPCWPCCTVKCWNHVLRGSNALAATENQFSRLLGFRPLFIWTGIVSVIGRAEFDRQITESDCRKGGIGRDLSKRFFSLFKLYGH